MHGARYDRQTVHEQLQLSLIGRLRALTSIVPERTVALAGRSSVREAHGALRRAMIADLFATLGDTLGAGDVSTDHLDVVARVCDRLDHVDRAALVAHDERLAGRPDNRHPSSSPAS